jgi:hypothetical protein
VIERGPTLSKQGRTDCITPYNSVESPRLRAWWQSPVSRSSSVSALDLRVVAQNDIQQ